MLSQIIPRLTALNIQNYRILKTLQLNNLTPLSVFIGSNGSGKSTLLEALIFLSDCFQNELKSTCQKMADSPASKVKVILIPFNFRLPTSIPNKSP